ncbi:MAG: Biopolymer transport protein ExbD/TolR [Bacteroidetes bacterium ADurb.Bin234]|jgi:biopolymer transport protein ExbD|nr:MAG: Biopolymer transport protein ExbD/TolR [Bacteroidetes bacterium ADurb.Bin234]
MAKKTPGLNTGSMADISFLLLTFFLLTSSINTDQGIQRRLPPPLQENQEVPKINQRNVLRILVNMHDQLLVNGEVLSDVRQLRSITKEFIENPTNDPHRSEKQAKYIDDLGENAMVSKGVVSLQNDRGTSYAMYIAVQNQLTMAFNELRDEYSQQRFGKPYEKISENQKKGVQKIYPISISEAEPSNYGGKK